MDMNCPYSEEYQRAWEIHLIERARTALWLEIREGRRDPLIPDFAVQHREKSLPEVLARLGEPGEAAFELVRIGAFKACAPVLYGLANKEEDSYTWDLLYRTMRDADEKRKRDKALPRDWHILAVPCFARFLPIRPVNGCAADV
jgi:hypothetical protein